MGDILGYFGVGGFALVFFSVFFEVTKIPLNPISWLGKKLNNATLEEVKKVNVHIGDVEDKLNNHMVESYRTSILEFMDQVLRGEVFTRDKWSQILNVCTAYETMIEQEGLVNGVATQAITFLRWKHQECLKYSVFADLPIPEGQHNEN